jgi:hypothetical protein
MATNLEKLHRKYREDALFRRVAIGSPTWAEMISEAIMKDRTGLNYNLASHNAASIDLVAENGKHVQVKTVGTLNSLAAIKPGRDTASEIMIVTTFGEAARLFLVPMDVFKQTARFYTYPDGQRSQWEISGSQIARAFNAYEITPPTAGELFDEIEVHPPIPEE